jgi:hypothetical protein
MFSERSAGWMISTRTAHFQTASTMPSICFSSSLANGWLSKLQSCLRELMCFLHELPICESAVHAHYHVSLLSTPNTRSRRGGTQGTLEPWISWMLCFSWLQRERCLVNRHWQQGQNCCLHRSRDPQMLVRGLPILLPRHRTYACNFGQTLFSATRC